MAGRAPPAVRLACRVYALMAAAYPWTFRERFGREMKLTFASQAQATYRRAGGRGLPALCVSVATDWIITLLKEYAQMKRWLIAAALLLVFLGLDWLAFHDWREPHTARDYLTLAASMLLFAYLGADLSRPWRGRPGPLG